MGQNRQALDIYVFKLKDPDKAEEWESPRVAVNLLIADCLPGFVIRSTSQKNLPSRQRGNRDDRPHWILRMLPLPFTTPFYLYTSTHHTRTNHNGVRLLTSSQSTVLVCLPLPR